MTRAAPPPETDPRVVAAAAAHPYPLLFATISGAHLYGFASPDSDFDVRGVHVLPQRELLGLDLGPETVETARKDEDGFELDLVTHDVRKFVGLLVKPNGYVLEQLCSPLVVVRGPYYEELRALAGACVTRLHRHHYAGFFHSQRALLLKDDPPKLKPLLYLFRVVLTGLRLLRTGDVEADLSRLAPAAGLPRLLELVERKRSGTERGTLDAAEAQEWLRAADALCEELPAAAESGPLPTEVAPATRRALHDLLLRVRGVASRRTEDPR